MNVKELNSAFARKGLVSFAEGRNGLAKAVMEHPSGARAEAYLHGAHVASWKTARGEEKFFVSGESWFEKDKPIRGGIPVIFPQFGAGPLPPHGIARISDWEVERVGGTPAGETALGLRLRSSPATMALWPYPFDLRLEVALGEALRIGMAAKNTGQQPFNFRAALHTYFLVGDIHRATVSGLKGVTLIDSLRENAREVETRAAVAFDRETDRIYVAGPSGVRLHDDARGRAILIEKEAMPDYVVWNPWIDKSRRMPDFGDEEYLRMVCVETGIIAESRPLGPGETWHGWTRFVEE